MKQKKAITLTVFFLMMILASSLTLAANVITISNYKTTLTLEEDNIYFEKHITLENTGKNTIIPGELHFKLYEITDKKIKTIPKITDLESHDKYNNDLSARIISKTGEAEVVVSAWQPIMPKFEYNIILKYKMKFEPKGILFHNLNLPDEETTIPIRNSKTTIKIPNSYSISYAPNATVTKAENFKIAEWDNIKEKTIEYTKLPFFKANIHGATIFWISLIFILTIPLVAILISELKNRN